jgi:hypothetical protein
MNNRHVPTLLSPATRRAAVALLWLLVGFAFTLHAAESKVLRSYASVILKDGRHFEQVRIINYTTNGILVRHAGGATVLPIAALPDALLSDLHLTRSDFTAGNQSDPAFQALANKPAVALDELAFKPAVAAGSEALAPAPVEPAGTTVPEAQAVAAAPTGEGNVPELVATPSILPNAAAATHTDVFGRVVVVLPTGETRLLADAEVRVYPAELLANYVRIAQAHSREAGRQVLAQAEVAAKEGRPADAERLTALAQETASRIVDHIPAAPFVARTDEHGHFTVRHNLRDARILAVGHIDVSGGKWRYEWIGVVPERETILTDANATAVAAPARLPQFASR